MTVTADEGLDLAGIRTLQQVLERTPNGNDLVEVLKKLRLWTEGAHNIEPTRRFPAQFSTLGANALSDWNSWFLSEAGRVHELLGVLTAQERYQVLRVKQTKADARGRVRRGLQPGEKLTVGELNDRGDEDPAVKTAEERLVLIQMLLDTVKAYRDGVILMLNGISREITYRTEQMKARLYGA